MVIPCAYAKKQSLVVCQDLNKEVPSAFHDPGGEVATQVNRPASSQGAKYCGKMAGRLL